MLGFGVGHGYFCKRGNLSESNLTTECTSVVECDYQTFKITETSFRMSVQKNQVSLPDAVVAVKQ
jgi:hypothetical protein